MAIFLMKEILQKKIFLILLILSKNEFQNSLIDSDELLTNFKIDKSNKEQTKLMNTILI